MKIEINNENKARFFALYWGQFIGVDYERTEEARHVLLGSCFGITDYLSLKPLSSISDDDAIEVARLAVPYTGRYELVEVRKTSIIFKLPYIGSKFQIFPCDGRCIQVEIFTGTRVEPMDSITPIRNIIGVIDYLRSRSYLLPFMGLSCEEIIDAGWAKYEEL